MVHVPLPCQLSIACISIYEFIFAYALSIERERVYSTLHIHICIIQGVYTTHLINHAHSSHLSQPSEPFPPPQTNHPHLDSDLCDTFVEARHRRLVCSLPNSEDDGSCLKVANFGRFPPGSQRKVQFQGFPVAGNNGSQQWKSDDWILGWGRQLFQVTRISGQKNSPLPIKSRSFVRVNFASIYKDLQGAHSVSQKSSEV